MHRPMMSFLRSSAASVLVLVSPAFAGPWVAGNTLWDTQVSLDPNVTSVIKYVPGTAGVGQSGLLSGDIRSLADGNPVGHRMWRDLSLLSFGRALPPAPLRMDSQTAFYDLSDQVHEVQLERLTIDNVQLHTGDIAFFFAGQNNVLDMYNGAVMAGQTPRFLATGQGRCGSPAVTTCCRGSSRNTAIRCRSWCSPAQP